MGPAWTEIRDIVERTGGSTTVAIPEILFEQAVDEYYTICKFPDPYRGRLQEMKWCGITIIPQRSY